MSLCLSPDELRELTGYKTPRRQAEWLRSHGWLYEWGGDGRPKVLREHVRRRLGGKEEEPKQEPKLHLP